MSELTTSPKYTEFLTDWLSNGEQLPAVFSQIDGFSDLFVGEYCESEIGFETPTLFGIKLEHRANLVFPAYVARRNELDNINNLLLNPTKVRVKSGSTERTREGEINKEYGKTSETEKLTKTGTYEKTVTDTNTPTASALGQTVKTWEQPFADATAASNTPSQISITTGNINQQTKTEQTTTEDYTNYGDNVKREADSHTDTESYNNYVENENYNDIREEETGLSAAEVLAIKQNYENEIRILNRELLDEFADLFMVIY